MSKENMNSAVMVDVMQIAAIKLEVVRDREEPVGVLLKHKETGKFRVMDAWGRFWAVQPPTDNGPSSPAGR